MNFQTRLNKSRLKNRYVPDLYKLMKTNTSYQGLLDGDLQKGQGRKKRLAKQDANQSKLF